MKKIAIIYSSVHHNNTEKLVKSIEYADVYNVCDAKNIDLSQYDLIGIASGIYFSKFHKSIVEFIEKNYNKLNNVFLVYTSGNNSKKYGFNFKKYLEEKKINVLDIYSCKGYDTYGPFKFIGGIAKNHPNQVDIDNFKTFMKKLIKE